jgi:hypothetical protein
LLTRSAKATDKFVVRFVGGTGPICRGAGHGYGIVVVNLLTGAFEITIVGDVDLRIYDRGLKGV